MIKMGIGALDMIYPIGSIYLSMNNVNPSSLFGGIWEQIKDRFLLACGNTYNPGDVGGEAKHTLSVDEIPSHYHNLYYNTEKSGYVRTGVIAARNTATTEIQSNASGIFSVYTQNQGGGQSHNNMPPYLSIYV